MQVSSQILGPKGSLSQILEGYEVRSGQVAMARAVENAIESRDVLMVEAGTGTGKTLAYLAPAILSGQRVLVSTATRNLQEQIFQKDLPLLAQALDVPFQAALLKGRSNYLCKERLEYVRDAPPSGDVSLMEGFLQVDRWAEETETGDRADLVALAEDHPLWEQLVSTSETCSGSKCPHFDSCFVVRARRKAVEADVLIVNHHLFFADLALKEVWDAALIPTPEVIVFDEAHGLEDIACQFFGASISNWRIARLVRDVRAALSRQKKREPHDEQIMKNVSKAGDHLFDVFASFSQGKTRLHPNNLPEDALAEMEVLCTHLAGLEGLCDRKGEVGDPLFGLAQRVGLIRGTLREVLDLEDITRVYCVERRGRGTFLQSLPISMADVFRTALFEKEQAMIFTSATLTTGGDEGSAFSHFRERMGANDWVESCVVPSPFRFDEQALLYLPDHLPNPNEAGFADAAALEMERIVLATQGRAFLLFTSYRVMEHCYRALADKLPFPVFCQGEAPKEFLLERFREQGNAVLFGTSSFWEGVDVAGQALSCVVIDRLPFQPLGDPLVQARMEWLRREERDPFHQLQVPQAILSLKQGFGRLIRNQQDRGVVVILDKRIRQQGYGRRFLEALPPCERALNYDDFANWCSGNLPFEV